MSVLEVVEGARPWWIEQGNCLDVLRAMPSGVFHVCATSPPYWGLRDYGLPPTAWGDGWVGCLGLEPTPAMFVAHVVEVFREVKRVLRPDATLWCNLGDSYNSNPSWGRGASTLQGRPQSAIPNKPAGGWLAHAKVDGLKTKDLLMIPARVAIALQEDGWYLRSEITWCKKSAMPESVTDRPSSATEKIYLLSPSPRYYYDADAVREITGNESDPAEYAAALGRDWADYEKDAAEGRGHSVSSQRPTKRGGKALTNPAGRNLRNYWLLGPEPLGDDHYAAWPTEVPRRAILAGTSERGVCPACGDPWRRVTERTKACGNTRQRNRGGRADGYTTGTTSGGYHLDRVETTGWEPPCRCDAGDPIPALALDIFSGSGRTGIAAQRLGRRYVGIELSEYQAAKSRARIVNDVGVDPEYAAEVAGLAQLRFDVGA